MTTGWRPLLRGTEADRALETVRAIAASRSDPAPSWAAGPADRALLAAEAAGLARGWAGMAVLQAYAARSRCTAHDRAPRMLDRAGRALATLRLTSSLFSGFSGIAWAHAHLDRLNRSAPPTELGAIDDAVIATVGGPWTEEYDLVSGLVGLGVYGVERLPSEGGARIVTLVLARLADLARREGEGLMWCVTQGPRPGPEAKPLPQVRIDLGMAHGVPGVVAFLGSACAAGFADSARPLLEPAVAWLLAQQLDARASGAFPCWVERGETPTAARLAWCYGDAGIAAALMLAACGMERDDWRGNALTIARRAVARTFEATGVRDAGLCHGAAGIGHICNRLYQMTDEPWLAAAARTWFARAMSLRAPGRGVAGFRCWERDADGRVGWHDDPGLLTGAAGVGLALLAAATDLAPDWDRCLLLSLRPPGLTA